MALVRVAVVRHANAGEREDWAGDDSLRPLTEKGWRQAGAVAELLSGIGVRRLVSSSYLRCVQTLEPASRALGLSIEQSEALVEGAGAAIMALLEGAVEPFAACTHGDVLAEMHHHLHALRLTHRDQPTAKGAAWLIDVDNGRLVAATYVEP